MTHNTSAVVAFGEPAWARHSKRILFLCTHLYAALPQEAGNKYKKPLQRRLQGKVLMTI